MDTHTAVQNLPQNRLPPYILASPFIQKGGFAVFEGLPERNVQQALLSEALEQLQNARTNEVTVPDDEDFRGGCPPRRFLSATGGAVQDAFYHAAWLRQTLYQITGLNLLPTGQHGTYSYYLKSRDHLALHRDIETCDLTLITCLHHRSTAATAGGSLYLYPGHLHEPLATLRRNPAVGSLRLRLSAGQALVFFGGIVPHYLSPLAEGQERIISVLCFRVYT